MKVTCLLRLCGGAAIGGRTLLLLRQVQRKRSGAARTAAAAAGATKHAKRPAPRRVRPISRKASDVSANTAGDAAAAPLSLADFHPAIARTWIAAASNKMLQPQHVAPDSRKLAWWICPSCHHQYNRRIDRHLAAGGSCPKCEAKPSLTPATKGSQRQRRAAASTTVAGKAATASTRRGSAGASPDPSTTNAAAAPLAVIAHKCRPNSALSTIAVDNVNMLSKSVADDHYLRVQETRNLLPMLAKNFENERAKIGESEVIRVSPKLDGIRCVVAYRADTQQVLFFSRSGTLFECCDDRIEPAVRHLFEADPTLVLDGELYNDSVNLAQLTALQRKGSISVAAAAAAAAASSSSVASGDPVAAFYAQLLAATTNTTTNAGSDAKTGGGSSSSGKRGSSSSTARSSSTSADEPVVIRFEQLTSAIRTTRQHLTPAVAALQRQLQYHVFDVLYARDFPNGSAATLPFSARYAFLESLLAGATRHNAQHIPHYNPLVLRLVPNVPCRVDQADAVLRAAMRVGYEGAMIRRETGDKPLCALQPAKSKVKRAATAAAAGGSGGSSGGYGYGKRSGTLLKFKVMQDAEFVIVGATEGTGKWKGSLGSFICVTPKTKQRFNVSPASNEAEKRRMWRTWRDTYQGKALTVQYQELTPDGVPRFPVGKSVRGAADGHDWL